MFRFFSFLNFSIKNAPEWYENLHKTLEDSTLAFGNSGNRMPPLPGRVCPQSTASGLLQFHGKLFQRVSAVFHHSGTTVLVKRSFIHSSLLLASLILLLVPAKCHFLYCAMGEN